MRDSPEHPSASHEAAAPLPTPADPPGDQLPSQRASVKRASAFRGPRRSWFRTSVLLGLVALTAGQLAYDPDLAEARHAEAGKNPANALKWSLAGLRRRPWSFEGARVTARSFSELLYPDEAEPYYQRLRRWRALRPADAHARALGLTRANLRDRAIVAYEAILKDDPNDALALQRLAAVQWARGDGDRAIAAAERLAKTPEGAVTGRVILAAVHHSASRRVEAIRFSREVLELDPRLERIRQPEVIFWVEFANDLIGEGLLDEVKRRLEPVAPRLNEPGLYDLLGSAYFGEGDRARAEELWRKSVSLQPDRAQPWLELGRLAVRERRPEEAASNLTRALDLRPNDYEALAAMSAAQRLLGHADLARDYQAKAVAAQKVLPTSTGGMGSDALPKP